VDVVIDYVEKYYSISKLKNVVGWSNLGE